MSTEKTIKNQAKQLLCGNWLTIIASVIFIAVIFILLQNLYSLVLLTTNCYDIKTMEIIESKQLIILFAFVAFGLVLFSLSPLINGVYKIIADVAKTGKSNISDLFFYFRNIDKYLKTLLINMIVCAIFLVLGFIADPVVFLLNSLKESVTDNVLLTIGITVAGAFVVVVSLLIKLVVYIIFVNYTLNAYAFNDDIGIIKCTFGIYPLALKNINKTFKLAMGFIGWMALCFFVIPAFYVLPYMLTSMSVSAKWLFSLEKNRGLLC